MIEAQISDLPIPIEKSEIGNVNEGGEMATIRQIEANRSNSLNSTGPTSEVGKAIVAQNALKHGILSAKVFIIEDEKLDFYTFSAHIHASLAPIGTLEEVLVDRIISTIWRLRRVIHVETLTLEKSVQSLWMEGTYQGIFEGNSGQAMSMLSRYERTLENSLFRALKELREIKAKTEINIPLFPSL